MLEAIYCRLKNFICAGNRAPTSIDLLLSVKANIRTLISLKNAKWKTNAESVRLMQNKKIEAMRAELGDLQTQFRAAQYPKIYVPVTYTSMELKSMMSCPTVEKRAIHWLHKQYVDFESLQLRIRTLFRDFRKHLGITPGFGAPVHLPRQQSLISPS